MKNIIRLHLNVIIVKKNQHSPFRRFCWLMIKMPFGIFVSEAIKEFTEIFQRLIFIQGMVFHADVGVINDKIINIHLLNSETL